MLISFQDFVRDPLQAAPSLETIWDPDVKNDDSGSLRVYKTPDGDFFSVTSILGYGHDMTWLEDWRERIGHEKADAISERSRERGTNMHAALEASIEGRDPWDASLHDGEAMLMARAIAEDLFPRVEKFLMSESAVWSKQHRYAGRTDSVGIVDGKPSIIDFKNARHKKKPEDIVGYFHQTSLYAEAIYERVGVACEDIYICVAYGDQMIGQRDIFRVKTLDWLPAAVDLVKKFHENYK